MEIVRNAELQEILDIIEEKPFSKILVSGAPGSGKSFLLNVLADNLEAQGKTIQYNTASFSLVMRNIYDDENNVVSLIDDVDEMYAKHQFFERIMDSRRCYVCTSRKRNLGIDFDYEIVLENLTYKQILLLVLDYLGTNELGESLIDDAIGKTNKDNLTPREVMNAIHSRIGNSEISGLIANSGPGVHQLYTYKSGVSLQYPNIVVPERKIITVSSEIKNDINVVTNSLIEKIAHRPELIQEITPRQFEELVCELFERKGYNVQLTKQTRDGGKDIIVLSNSLLGDLVIYAECKKRATKHPVDVGLVRQLYGTVEADRATAGIMVTNSYFSKDARKFQQTIKSRMSLIDYTELMKQIMECK